MNFIPAFIINATLRTKILFLLVVVCITATHFLVSYLSPWEPYIREAGSFYEGRAVVWSKYNKAGCIDTSGQIIIPVKYDNMFNFQEGVAGAQLRGKWGFLGKNGKWAIPPVFDEVWTFNGGLAAVKKGDKWGYINKTGEIVIPALYDRGYDFHDGVAPVEFNGKRGYINTGGEWVLRPEYENGYVFNDGIAAVCDNGKWGYINTRGGWLLKPQFTDASGFEEGMAVVLKDTGYGYIDKSGQVVIPPVFSLALNFKEGRGLVLHKKWGYINHPGQGGKAVIPFEFDEATRFNDGVAAVSIHNPSPVWGYIDRDGHILTGIKFGLTYGTTRFSHGLGAVKIDGRCCYIDKKGDIIIRLP